MMSATHKKKNPRVRASAKSKRPSTMLWRKPHHPATCYPNPSKLPKKLNTCARIGSKSPWPLAYDFERIFNPRRASWIRHCPHFAARLEPWRRNVRRTVAARMPFGCGNPWAIYMSRVACWPLWTGPCKSPKTTNKDKRGFIIDTLTLIKCKPYRPSPCFAANCALRACTGLFNPPPRLAMGTGHNPLLVCDTFRFSISPCPPCWRGILWKNWARGKKIWLKFVGSMPGAVARLLQALDCRNAGR